MKHLVKQLVAWPGWLFFLLLSTTASQAGVDTARPGAETFAIVSGNDSGTFDYRVFTFAGFPAIDGPPVLNMADFYLPYFPDLQLANIQPPADWTYAIEKGSDLFQAGGSVLHFSTSVRDESVQDFGYVFSFQAGFDGINGPYRHRLAGAHTDAVEYNSGTGWQIIPGSPMALAAFASPVPERPGVALLLGGLALLGGLSLRRNQRAAG